MTCATHIILCIVFASFHSGLAQQPTYDIHLGDLYRMQKGVGWPNILNVFEGHEALLRLANSLDNQQACEVTTPVGEHFDVNHPPSTRYEVWGDGCGLRVKNVVPADNGRWRLTAVRGTDSITGWTELYVEENIDQYNTTPILLHDGETHTKVELTTLSNSYCLVAQPFSESSLVPGHCTVTLDRTTRAVQGNWHVLLGMPGRVSELQVDRTVAVESERLNIGFLHENNPSKIHIYCNILHTAKNITFCRFQKTSERAGFNIMEGLSDGTHSYYGEGFAKRECGITIESPSANDLGTWRCTVGVQEWVGTVIEQKTPMQALIRVVNTRSQRINKDFRNDFYEHRTVFVQGDMSFTISCQADTSLTYCWFQHPNGSQYTPVEKVDDDQQFWYTGESLQTGACGITFAHSTADESGLWTCHMGPRDQVGEELTDKVNVRVTGPLAAIDKEIVASIGGNATLYCHTSNGNRPLDYCRFLSPNFLGISIDSTVTEENAVQDRFFFTPGRNLNYGDCSLTISPVLPEDMGEWTCAALVDEEILEARDTIQVFMEEAPRLNAGVIGMSVGAAIIIIALAGLLVYRYRDYLRNITLRQPIIETGRAVAFSNEAGTNIRRLSQESSSTNSSSGQSPPLP